MSWIVALLLSAQVAAGSTPVESCAGGRQIFFEPNSDRLGSYEIELLERFASSSLEAGLRTVARIRIESGGDGSGDHFDRSLSLRRSGAIRAFLIARGFSPEQIEIAVDRYFGGSSNDEASPERREFERMGWVAQLISAEEYRRRYPPGLIVECF
jgi:hypothetical protein